MMKKIIHFSHFFVPFCVMSSLIIAFGVYGFFTKGFNLGLDFSPGLIDEIKIAPTAFELKYTGNARAVVQNDANGISLIISGAGAENETYPILFAENPTVEALVNKINSLTDAQVVASLGASDYVPPITAIQKDADDTLPLDADNTLPQPDEEGAESSADAAVTDAVFLAGTKADATEPTAPVAAQNAIERSSADSAAIALVESSAIFVDASVSTVLSGVVPYRYHYIDSANLVNADTVRGALEQAEVNAEVKQLGAETDNNFQIRVGDTGEESSNKTMQDAILQSLRAVFGADCVVTVKTDFVGAEFSQSLAFKSLFTVLATLVLIGCYSAFRFKWDFAVGAVLAVIHDALIIFTFIIWMRMEFSTVILAAVLTIIGYSINDTIVVLDRVRENMQKNLQNVTFNDIWDTAQTEVLNRTIITTVTTLLAVISLYVATTGSMKDFAQALIVGMLSGVYSTIFTTGGFISAVRKNWKPPVIEIAK
ncbi:MAG: hypothetical protein Ta2A_19980 [Treponemataceae bacterium]|nr:MAG: hypothetical protein Ta2A_19980 [Treponemataceae bacterium]